MISLLLICLLPSLIISKKCFYSVSKEKIGSTWWLVDPTGKRQLTKGVDAISFWGSQCTSCPSDLQWQYRDAVTKKYGNQQNWATNTTPQLTSWGFNTAGAWSDSVIWALMPYTVILGIASNTPGSDWLTGGVADYFDTPFSQTAQSQVQKLVLPYINDEKLIGYFTDNELRWGADWRSTYSLLETYYNFSSTAPGRAVAIQTLKDQYNNNISTLNNAWGLNVADFNSLTIPFPSPTKYPGVKQAIATFDTKVSTQYHKICYDAIRAVDPYHLILGDKTAGFPSQEVMTAMAPYVDVISVDWYESTFDLSLFQKLYNWTQKPFLIAEFAVRARDSGLPNTQGAGPLVDTQAERANMSMTYIRTLVQSPSNIGYHWFMFSDEPAQGRFDGENSNYGLWSNNATEYTTLVNAFITTNQQVDGIHGSASNELLSGAKCYPVITCPNNCSLKGCCDLTTGVCACPSGLSGIDCSQNNGIWNYSFTSIDYTRIWPWSGFANTGTIDGYNSSKAVIKGNTLQITLDNVGCPTSCVNQTYGSSGFSTNSKMGFGVASVRMKVPKGSGIKTYFQFTTGAWIDPNDYYQQVWIQIYGVNNTNQINCGWATNVTWTPMGTFTLNHTDLSLDYHDYTINWSQTGGISWLVDGVELVHQISGPKLPVTAGKLELALDAVASSTTLGNFTYTGPISLYLQSLSFSKEGGIVPLKCPGCSDPKSCDYNPTANSPLTCGQLCNPNDATTIFQVASANMIMMMIAIVMLL